MCVARTARRRRQQAKSGFKHLCKRQRPNYAKVAADISAHRTAAVVQRENERRRRKGMKK